MFSNSVQTSQDRDAGNYSISAVHPDIIRTHILTRLDGPALASIGSTTTQLKKLCAEENLWMNICNSSWPSTDDQRVRDIVSTFSAGHRSFFWDSFSVVDQNNCSRRTELYCPSSVSSQLISVVDIHYGNKLLFSKAEVLETGTDWFLCSPLRVDLLDPKDSVPTPVKLEGDREIFKSNLDKNLTLSWILIDPTRKRAANMSSLAPVSVEKHWLNDEVRVRYATVLAGDRQSESSGFVECSMVVVCGGKEGGELEVREVSLEVKDMEGKSLSGRDSLVILEDAMDGGRRKRGQRGEERERYEEFMEMKRESRERKQMREKRLDMMFIVTGVTIFMSFWGFILC